MRDHSAHMSDSYALSHKRVRPSDDLWLNGCVVKMLKFNKKACNLYTSGAIVKAEEARQKNEKHCLQLVHMQNSTEMEGRYEVIIPMVWGRR